MYSVWGILVDVSMAIYRNGREEGYSQNDCEILVGLYSASVLQCTLVSWAAKLGGTQ